MPPNKNLNAIIKKEIEVDHGRPQHIGHVNTGEQKSFIITGRFSNGNNNFMDSPFVLGSWNYFECVIDNGSGPVVHQYNGAILITGPAIVSVRVNDSPGEINYKDNGRQDLIASLL